jgi:polysaccharide pyruvyl transferase WcaK-like protein
VRALPSQISTASKHDEPFRLSSKKNPKAYSWPVVQPASATTHADFSPATAEKQDIQAGVSVMLRYFNQSQTSVELTY